MKRVTPSKIKRVTPYGIRIKRVTLYLFPCIPSLLANPLFYAPSRVMPSPELLQSLPDFSRDHQRKPTDSDSENA